MARAKRKRTTTKRRKRQTRSTAPARRTVARRSAAPKRKIRRRRFGGGASGLPTSIKKLAPVAVTVAAGFVGAKLGSRLILKEKDAGVMGYAGMAAMSAAALLAGRKVLGNKTASALALGGLVAVVDRVLREQVLPKVAPGMAMAGLDEYYMDPAMIPAGVEGLGYIGETGNPMAELYAG